MSATDIQLTRRLIDPIRDIAHIDKGLDCIYVAILFGTEQNPALMETYTCDGLLYTVEDEDSEEVWSLTPPDRAAMDLATYLSRKFPHLTASNLLVTIQPIAFEPTEAPDLYYRPDGSAPTPSQLADARQRIRHQARLDGNLDEMDTDE